MSSPFRTLWQKWKSLQLPWRRRWLAGIYHPSPPHQYFLLATPSTLIPIALPRANLSLFAISGADLAGNTYYYFRPHASAKPRRILQQNPRIPYSDIKIPVQWLQWLRHTRPTAPTIQELQLDVVRKEQLKQLAAAADKRWASKPSVLDQPRRRNQELGVGDGEGSIGMTGRKGESTEAVDGGEGRGQKLEAGIKGEDVRDSWGEGEKGRGPNPWVKARPTGAGESYQPESWQPPGSGR